MKMDKHKLLTAICEALVIYGLIIVGYGILVIHITRTWSGDWPVDRNLHWFTLDIFIMISFALSFFAYIAWKYLKSLDASQSKLQIFPKVTITASMILLFECPTLSTVFQTMGDKTMIVRKLAVARIAAGRKVTIIGKPPVN
jgi:hypothetical protein